jgi:hypothetical protein
MVKHNMGTIEKALKINLDPNIYGTIAEIGAGQEVARHFFQAGAAAGTVAKTISAYDMQVSDSIYGQESCGRYVSRSRAKKMIDYEYDLLVARLKDIRPPETTYFAFADTIVARSYKSRGECHGWLAIKLQLTPNEEPSEIILHIRLFDQSNKAQQTAVGILGINLIHAAFYHHNDVRKLVDSLMEELSWERVEIDYINFKGPGFKDVDNRLISLYLIESRVANAVMFLPDGKTSLASEDLYKKDIIAIRGVFRPITNIHIDMAQKGLKQFIETEHAKAETTEVIFEMNMATYIDQPNYGASDMLARIDLINSLGYKVLVTHFLRYFRLSEYLKYFCKKRIRFLTSVNNIKAIFNEQFYQSEEGGLLGACGKLFSNDTRLYVYPNLVPNSDIQTLSSIDIADNIKHLFLHLLLNNKIVDFNEHSLERPFLVNEIITKIALGDKSWIEYVPQEVASLIIEKRLFGYNSDIQMM